MATSTTHHAQHPGRCTEHTAGKARNHELVRTPLGVHTSIVLGSTRLHRVPALPLSPANDARSPRGRLRPPSPSLARLSRAFLPPLAEERAAARRAPLPRQTVDECAEMQPRCRRDSGEIHGRYSGDAVRPSTRARWWRWSSAGRRGRRASPWRAPAIKRQSRRHQGVSRASSGGHQGASPWRAPAAAA